MSVLLPENATGDLIRALRTGDPDRVEKALAQGPDLNYRHDGLPLVAMTIGMMEIDDHLPAILDLLLSSGAPMDSAPDPRLLASGRHRYTMLAHREILQREDVLSTLMACRGDDSDSLAVLLEHGADPTVVHDCPGFNGYGPTELAVTRGFRRCLAQLLTHGADPNGVSGNLLMEVRFGSTATQARQVVGILLGLGADPTAVSESEPVSVLVHPLINRCYGTVLDLVMAGADASVRLSPQTGCPTGR